MWYFGRKARTKRKTAQGLMEIGRIVAIQMDNNRTFRNQLKKQGILSKIDLIMLKATR